MEDSTAPTSEHEALIEFVYQCPIALCRMSNDGAVDMMNSTGAQLLMPLARDPEISNLFEVLDRYAPELRRLVVNGPQRGAVCENYRVMTDAPGPGGLKLVLAVSMIRLNKEQVMALISDASRQVAIEQKAAETQLRLQSVLDGIVGEMLGYAVLPLGLAGNVEQWSGPAEHILGFKAAEVVGQPLGFLMGPSEVVADLLARGQSGERARGEVVLRHESGRRVPGQCTISPVSADGKRPLALMCLLHGLD